MSGRGALDGQRSSRHPDSMLSKVRTIDMWGFAESQETVGVSPEMYSEFIFPYQKTILERFGLNCYGCCEPLDRRWEYVRTFPRLRRVSVSPWSDVKRMAELLQGNYIFSLKPSPVPLAGLTWMKTLSGRSCAEISSGREIAGLKLS